MAGLVASGHSESELAEPPAGQLSAPLDRLRTGLASLAGPTPRKVRASVAAVILLACGLGVLVAAFSADVGSGFGAIGRQDAPLVENSTGLYFSVNDMDAQVANVLLAGNTPALAADRQTDLATYAQDRQRADSDLRQVTATAAMDPMAQRAVGSMLDALGRYEALAADAMLLNQRGHDLAGKPSAATLSYYRQATDLMRTQVLPAALALTSANAKSLEAAYAQSRSAAATGRLLIPLCGLMVVLALGGLQCFLARRYRRLVNPALVIATVLASGLTVAGIVQLSAQAEHLRVAKQDAFDSVLALTQAKAISFDANADESRYLVDPGRAARYQDAFAAKSAQLANVGDVGIYGYDGALGTDIVAYQRDHSDVRFGGYLGAEFRNITFPGERAAATRALQAFQVYERDDRRLRNMASSNLDQAIAFDVGTRPGQSDWAFSSWDTALSSVITINESAFNAAVAAGDGTKQGWTGVIPAMAVVAIAGFAAAGTWRRLTEYR